MKSKVKRVYMAIDNMSEAANLYIRYAKAMLYKNEMTKNECSNLTGSLNEIIRLLSLLSFSSPFTDKKLNEIRSINLSVKPLYQDNDYDRITLEAMRANSVLAKDDRENDTKILNQFKNAYNRVSYFYKYRLSKAAIKATGGICYRSDNFDNYLTITGNYLSAKYNLTKVPFETKNIDSKYQTQIDECRKIVTGENYNEQIKNIYLNIIDFILGFAKAEVVIKSLHQMKELCMEPVYDGVKAVIDELILKYQTLYNENLMNYNRVISHIGSKITTVEADGDSELAFPIPPFIKKRIEQIQLFMATQTKGEQPSEGIADSPKSFQV